MFNELTTLVSEASTWAYLVVLLFAALDVFVPVVPSETAVITAGVLAAEGELALSVILLCAASGAFLGDNSAYFVASRIGERAVRRIRANERGRRSLDRARRQLDSRSGELIIVGRFIPGGRSAVALTAGMTRFPWRRFAVFDAIAGAVWACYAGLLGYLGGRVFGREPWRALLVALLVAVAIGGLTELVRRLLARRKRPAEGRGEAE